MKYIKKFENSEDIILRGSIGEIVLDYLKILETGDFKIAKKYLIKWTGGGVKVVWDGESYVPTIILTLNRFMTPANRQYHLRKGCDVIEITKKLLDEIKQTK